MATRTIIAAGGSWNQVGTWAEGATPNANDVVIGAATSGSITVLSANCRCSSLNLSAYVSEIKWLALSTLNATQVTLISGLTSSGTGVLLVSGITTNNSAGAVLGASINLVFSGARTTLLSDWTVAGNLVTKANLTANGFSFIVRGGVELLNYSGTTTINMVGTGVLTTNGVMNGVLIFNTTGNVTLPNGITRCAGQMLVTAGNSPIISSGNNFNFIGRLSTINMPGVVFDRILGSITSTVYALHDISANTVNGGFFYSNVIANSFGNNTDNRCGFFPTANMVCNEFIYSVSTSFNSLSVGTSVVFIFKGGPADMSLGNTQFRDVDASSGNTLFLFLSATPVNCQNIIGADVELIENIFGSQA